MKKMNNDVLLTVKRNERKDLTTQLGTRAFYNIILLAIVLITNYAVILWFTFAINAIFFYVALRDLYNIIEEERNERTGK